MDIFKIIGVAFIGAILSITIEDTKKEMAQLILIATSMVILYMLAGYLGEFYYSIQNLTVFENVNFSDFSIAIKACVISYICRFASDMLNDFGKKALSSKVELAGKISILLITVPLLSNFFNAICDLLEGL